MTLLMSGLQIALQQANYKQINKQEIIGPFNDLTQLKPLLSIHLELKDIIDPDL